jgi:hypothetical protein
VLIYVGLRAMTLHVVDGATADHRAKTSGRIVGRGASLVTTGPPLPIAWGNTLGGSEGSEGASKSDPLEQAESNVASSMARISTSVLRHQGRRCGSCDSCQSDTSA